jgi:hypothetical protein
MPNIQLTIGYLLDMPTTKVGIPNIMICIHPGITALTVTQHTPTMVNIGIHTHTIANIDIHTFITATIGIHTRIATIGIRTDITTTIIGDQGKFQQRSDPIEFRLPPCSR